MKKTVQGFIALFFMAMLVNYQSANAQTPTKQAHDQEAKPYDPTANAQKDINRLVAKAKKENKNIIIQAGGNWCVWCLRFVDFIEHNQNISKVLDQNFLYYHLNYSPENNNEKVFNKYAPNKGKEFGYPFFIVLDKRGKVLTVRESGNLEEGKGYNEEKVLGFFNEWLPNRKK